MPDRPSIPPISDAAEDELISQHALASELVGLF